MTKQQRRTFSTESKVDTASSVLDQGYSVPEATRSMDVGETAATQLKIERGDTTPTGKAFTPEQ